MTALGHILDADTLALWRADETSGSLVDATGNGYDLPVGGGAVGSATGLIGRARDTHAGAFQRTFLLSVPTESTFINAWFQPFTLEFWVAPFAAGGSQEDVLAVFKDSLATFPPTMEAWVYSGGSGPGLPLPGVSFRSLNNQTPPNPHPRIPGQWTHHAIVYSLTSPGHWNTSNFHDGIRYTSLDTTTPPPALPASSLILALGGYNYSGIYWNGLVDDIRFSSRARTDAEILESFQRGTGQAAAPDAKQRAYARQLQQLLPPGRLWLLEQTSNLYKTLLGISEELVRVDERGADLINETDPRTASETLAEWEKMLSLPDGLILTIPATTAGRRVAITQKYTARGGQTAAYFIQLAAACGYAVTVQNYNAQLSVSGRLQSGQALCELNGAYAMLVTVSPPTGIALTHAQLEAVLRHATHSHITVAFTYL